MKKKTVIRLVLAVIGISALSIGLMQGGFRDALQKAIYLCLECVGIG